MEAARDKILKDSKTPVTESSLGAVLPETPEAKSGCVMMISLSLHDVAVVGWHRERGAPDPCATQGHHGAKLELGKASHKAGCCCLLTIATAQTCSRAAAEALGPLEVKHSAPQPSTGGVCCRTAAASCRHGAAAPARAVGDKVHPHFFLCFNESIISPSKNISVSHQQVKHHCDHNNF